MSENGNTIVIPQPPATARTPAATEGKSQGRRFLLLHPALAKMEQDNAELVKRNLARAEENAFLQARVALLEGQCHTALCRLDDALNFIRGLRQALRESGETRPEINNQIAQNTNRTIELFLEENKP